MVIQLNASGTTRPIDILVDEIELSARRENRTRRHPPGSRPAGPRRMGRARARGRRARGPLCWRARRHRAPPLPARRAQPEELHNPVEFAVEYGTRRFAVQVGNTSGGAARA